MNEYKGWWVWRIGANSRLGIAYRAHAPADESAVYLCGHRHRSECIAVKCGERLARKLNRIPA